MASGGITIGAKLGGILLGGGGGVVIGGALIALGLLPETIVSSQPH